MSITLSQRLSLSLKQIFTEDQIEQSMIDVNDVQHQSIIEAICQEYAIEKISFEKLKQLIQDMSLKKFEAYNDAGFNYCTTTITSIWLDNRNFFNFLRKNPEYSNEDDSSHYDFLELVNHAQITDPDECYIYYVSEKDWQQFILVS